MLRPYRCVSCPVQRESNAVGPCEASLQRQQGWRGCDVYVMLNPTLSCTIRVSPPRQSQASLLMLSSFSRCLNAVQAYYNYCPSYTLRITFRNLPFQKTGRLAAHLKPHEVHTDCASSTHHSNSRVSAWKCLHQLFRVDV